MSVPSSWLQPGKVWSVWELMSAIHSRFADWVKVIQYFDEMREMSEKESKYGTDYMLEAQEVRQGHIQGNEYVITILKNMNFVQTVGWLKLFNEKLEQPCTHSQFAHWCQQTIDILNVECEVIKVMVVSADIDRSMTEIFGEGVAARFREEMGDLNQAHRCRLLGNDTAAVFHIFRSLESVLRLFAGKLRVGLYESRGNAKSWSTLASHIETKIQAIPAPRSQATKSRKQKMSAAIATFKGMNVERNEVSHPGKQYTQADSEFLFAQTRLFLSQLDEFI